jgi:hypothetical protein
LGKQWLFNHDWVKKSGWCLINNIDSDFELVYFEEGDQPWYETKWYEKKDYDPARAFSTITDALVYELERFE